MSGTSLDGLDVAFCRFTCEDKSWKFDLLEAETFSYDGHWRKRLQEAHLLPAARLMELHHELGILHGSMVRSFIRQRGIRPEYIASHGHTVLHDPARGYTLQIGNDADIAVQTGVDVISDFRSLDVAMGGQGAPLVPVGDRYLFGEYDACLNLGGISNISFEHQGKRVAFDISLCNILLNAIAQLDGKSMDEKGAMAASGKEISALLEKWNSLDYYTRDFPKSLGREFFECFYKDDITLRYSIQDLMHTAVLHIARQVGKVTRQYAANSILATGGGVKNTYLLECIGGFCGGKLMKPPGDDIIDFKEAIIFGFLGALRIQNEVNTLGSVTGAVADSVGGVIRKAPPTQI